MVQTKFTTDGVAENPGMWFDHHANDYMAVLDRLARTRRVTLTGDIDRAAENLKMGFINAVMSIKTEKDRHERAFTAWTAGDESLKDAMLMTVYGGQKHDWVTRTLDKVDWSNLVLAVRAHVRAGRVTDLLGMCEHLVGVSHAKWSFTLAMCGIWELACADSNVVQHMDIDKRDAADLDSADAYAELITDIRDAIPQAVPPFLVQWAIYDMERGEHARHMPFFQEVNLA